MARQVIGHVEIPVKDLDKSQEFYRAVFGWDLKPFGNGYYLFNSREGMTIGLRKSNEVKAGNTTIFHIHVDDIDKHVDLVKAAGGSIFREKTVIPVYGWYALFTDIDGNIMGLFQSH
ncbi:MAG: VOC family protein [Ignavibacteria bacterium]|nr:VOC family protein [Ignavibacteria bacterium]